MFKPIPLLFLLILFGCGGSLSDEQRKKIKEEMIRGTIQKVSDAEITEAAFVKGRAIADLIPGADRSQVDSLEKAYQVKIVRLVPGDSALLAIEKMVIDAYASGSNPETFPDNLQAINQDTLLFTRPVMLNLPDGTSKFEFALGIRMPRRDIILSLREK